LNKKAQVFFTDCYEQKQFSSMWAFFLFTDVGQMFVLQTHGDFQEKHPPNYSKQPKTVLCNLVMEFFKCLTV
jgi:hypothetical protein